MDSLGSPSASQSQHRLTSSQSAQQISIPSHRMRPVSSNLSVAFPHNQAIQALLSNQAYVPSSRTWTPSSGGLGLLSDADEVQDRAVYVEEYNRLAKKHGVRLLIVGDFDFDVRRRNNGSPSPKRHGWLYRIFRGTSSQSTPSKTPPASRTLHKRSVSDLGYLIRSRPETSKAIEIQDMVRLSRKSVLYLPPEYSPCSLILPTCIRATAQYIAQNATTRGIFRIPGSVKVVNSLYDYYCYTDNNGPTVSGTVCRATLPTHIPFSVHDVASTFKRFLSVLPGGILGSLALFDAFIGIHSQLHGQPEFPRTKQTKVRARLIALAIGTIESQFRRELICAVFGLLSLIGRIAEVSPHEDCDGRPLPTSDLMGYSALGIVFGPLLVRDLLDHYAMKLASPTSGLLLFPLSPKKQRRDRRKVKATRDPKSDFPQVDKVMVAISIAEMLIANWRDVVRQMKGLGTHFRHDTASLRLKHGDIHSSVSDSLVASVPADSDVFAMEDTGDLADRDCSPEPETPTRALRRGRSRLSRQTSGREMSGQPSCSHLSPTLEEGNLEKARHSSPDLFLTASAGAKARSIAMSDRKITPVSRPLFHEHDGETARARRNGSIPLMHSCSCQEATWISAENALAGFTQSISMGAIPPRVSSRHTNHFGVSMTTPTLETDSGNTDIKRMLTPEGSLVKVSKGTKGGEGIESQATRPVHWTIRSPLSDRLHEKKRAFGNLLTRSAERLRGMQANVYFAPPPELWDTGNAPNPSHYHLHPFIYTHESASNFPQSVQSAKTNPYAETNGPSESTEWTAPRLREAGQDGSIFDEKPRHGANVTANLGHFEPENGNDEARLPDLISIGSDASQEGNNSKQSVEGKTPTKRRSVRALAAMFEGQNDSPSMTRKTRTGVSNDATNLTEGSDQDKPMPSRIQSSPQKSSRLAKTLHSYPEAPEDADLKDMENEKYSPGSNTWSLVTKQDDTQGSCGSSGRRVAPLDMREEGTQTEADDETLLASMSSITRYSFQDHSTMTDCELFSHVSSCTGTEDVRSRLQELERLLGVKSAEAAQLKVRMQQLEEYDTPNSPTLPDQVRDANREIQKWRERAEIAERKAKMFQKFTTRIRSIHSSLVTDAEGSRQSGDELCKELPSKKGRDAEGSYQVHRVRFTKSREAREREADGIVGDRCGLLEDGSVVSAKTQRHLHHSRSKDELSIDELKVALSDICGMDGVASPKEEGQLDFGLAAVELWIAAQELLLMEDEEAVQQSSSTSMEESYSEVGIEED
ncbi:hypothetical protein V8C37DRAFT_419992 [Trichoderma ceciliae]